jgi:hypothetical protein
MLLRDVHERQILAAVFLDFSDTEYALAIGINQDRDNVLRMISMLASRAVLRFQTGGI